MDENLTEFAQVGHPNTQVDFEEVLWNCILKIGNWTREEEKMIARGSCGKGITMPRTTWISRYE